MFGSWQLPYNTTQSWHMHGRKGFPKAAFFLLFILFVPKGIAQQMSNFSCIYRAGVEYSAAIAVKDDVFFCWKELKHINIPNILTALAAANLTPGSIKLNQWQQLTQPMEAPNSTPEIIKINSSVLAFQHCSMHCEV